MTSVAVGVFNIVFVLLAAPLFDGVMRQVKARIHSRRGPSILQTYFDLGKLMVKEDQLAVNNFIFSVTPIICLGSVLLAALFVPMGGVVPLGFAGDTLVLVYVLTMGPICLCLGGMASGSPYAYLGVNREIMMLMVVEPVMAKVPFDLPEAEQEIMEGPLIEYSGRKLAMLKWSFYCKQIVLLTLFMEWFVPWPAVGSLPLRIVLTLVKVLVGAVLVEVIAQVFPRLKIAQSMRYFVSVIAVALTGLMLAVMGL